MTVTIVVKQPMVMLHIVLVAYRIWKVFTDQDEAHEYLYRWVVDHWPENLVMGDLVLEGDGVNKQEVIDMYFKMHSEDTYYMQPVKLNPEYGNE